MKTVNTTELSATLTRTNTKNAERIDEHLSSEELAQLGLTEEDQGEINAVLKDLESIDGTKIIDFGARVSMDTTSTDRLLGMVKNSDLDETTATKLKEVGVVARKIGGKKALSANRKQSLFSRIYNAVTGAKLSFEHQFESSKATIDKLIADIEKQQTGLMSRIDTMSDLYKSTQEDYHSLGIHVAAGKMRLNRLTKEINMKTIDIETSNNPELQQELGLLRQQYTTLEKRVSDLHTIQQVAIQQLPMIQIIQNNSLVLVDTFRSFKAVTIPSWKRQITLSIALQEQKNAAQLATSINDTTNELLKSNSDLLKQNSIEITKQNQRGIVDVETLEYTQKNLLDTVDAILTISSEGAANRIEAARKLSMLQADLRQIGIKAGKDIVMIETSKRLE